MLRIDFVPDNSIYIASIEIFVPLTIKLSQLIHTNSLAPIRSYRNPNREAIREALSKSPYFIITLFKHNFEKLTSKLAEISLLKKTNYIPCVWNSKANTSEVIPLAPRYRQPPFASSLLKSQCVPTFFPVRVHARDVVQGAGGRIQKHRAGRPSHGLHGLDLEPVKTGPCLWYREILVLRALVRKERRSRLQGLHRPTRLR